MERHVGMWNLTCMVLVRRNIFTGLGLHSAKNLLCKMSAFCMLRKEFR